MEDEDIKGPVFISIGDSEKLNVFLDANPKIPREKVFVDDYTFGAYKAVGFKSFTDVDKEVAKQVKMTAPDLGFGEFMKYFSVVSKVSPIPKDMKFGEIPEGVLRLGGTFVVNGDDVVYQWNDRLPGDHPDIEEVLKIASESEVKNKWSFANLF